MRLLPRELPGTREQFAPIELAPEVTRHLERVIYEGPSPMQGRVNRIIGWDTWTYTQKTAFIRKFVEDTSRDPALADKAQRILRDARVQQRDHRAAWAALLRWVQRNIAYQNEPRERLQSPQFTLSTGGPGDCDDLVIALAGLGASLRLPYLICLSGRDAKGVKVRWIEGFPEPQGFDATHIFLRVGGPPFKPTWWEWAEPTLDVPLGWDLMKDPIPKGREDLGAVQGGETVLQKAKNLASKVPWSTVAGITIAGFLTQVVVRHFVSGKR